MIFTAVKDSYSGEESLLGGNKLNEGNIDSNQDNIKNTIDNIIVPKTGDSGLGIYFVIFIIVSIAILTLNFDFIKNKLKIFKKRNDYEKKKRIS
ncbi:MAG: hypothetical protein ACLU4S_15545 [Clostridium perfringens]